MINEIIFTIASSFKKIIGTNKFITNLKTLEKNVIDFIQKPPLKQNDS